MTKPYTIVHMMMSVDGRIDCGMTAQLRGNQEYYSTLDTIDAASRITGSGTAANEMAVGISSYDGEKIGHEDFAMNRQASSYNIIADSQGRTKWGNDRNNQFPHLILVSEDVSRDYLDDLDKKHISWIATGKQHVDLKRAMEILSEHFNVKRLAVVGGGHINGGFINNNLVDELSVVIGPGIDGRSNQPSLFEGVNNNGKPISLQLKDVQKYDDGTVWLRYLVMK